MRNEKKDLTFTSREHEILHDLICKAMNENPDDMELLLLIGTLSSIWLKEIYEGDEIDEASYLMN